MSVVSAASLIAHVDSILDQQLEELIGLRRHLHANPELSWHEAKTTKHLKAALDSHGVDSTIGPRERGLIVDLNLGETGQAQSRCVAIRGDIDAIPVEERTGLPYASRNPGIMHACGHDFHATILFGTLVVLDRLRRNGHLTESVTVRGIFQPAEEIAQGASAIIDANWLKGVEAIFGFHVDPSHLVGRVGVNDGVHTAFCDEVKIVVEGQGGHSARPHETDDPVFAAVQLINALYGTIPRKIDSRQPVVLSICKVNGGSIGNIIPQSVELLGTLRCLDIRARETAREQIHRIVRGMQTLTGTDIQLSLIDKVPGVINDPSLMEIVRQTATELWGAGSIDEIDPSVGGEDFSFYTQLVSGAFTRIGCGSDSAGYWHLHSPSFRPDEKCIRNGVRLMVSTLLNWMALA